MSPNTWINKDRQRITFPRNLSSAASRRNTNLSKALGAIGAVSQHPWRSMISGIYVFSAGGQSGSASIDLWELHYPYALRRVAALLRQ